MFSKLKFYIVGLLIVVIIVLSMYRFFNNNHVHKINEKVESVHGEVINIDHRTFSKGPFWYSNKNSFVYRFEYIQSGEKKVGWVYFNGFSTKWKLDYKH